MTQPSIDHLRERVIHNMLQLIVDNASEKSLNRAVNYAREGLTMSGRDLQIQCLYILGNMTRWRGTEARVVRETLKKFTKGM